MTQLTLPEISLAPQKAREPTVIDLVLDAMSVGDKASVAKGEKSRKLHAQAALDLEFAALNMERFKPYQASILRRLAAQHARKAVRP